MNENENRVETERGETLTENEPENVPESEIDKVNKRNENEKLNNLLLINTFYYIFVFVVIGLPIWFLTTSTYRASLPFHSIDEISSSLSKIDYQVKFNLVYYGKEIQDNKLEEIQENFFKEIYNGLNHDKELVLTFKLRVRASNNDEYNFALNSKTLEEFDEKVSEKEIDVLKISILDDSLSAKFDIQPENGFIFLNNLILNQNSLKDIKKLADYIKNQYLNIKKLNENYKSKLDTERKLPSQNDLKIVNFDSEYEIIFSLINEKPETYPNWNIDFCIKNYFQNVVDQLSKFTSFSLKAQTLLYSDFGSYPISTAKSDDNTTFFYLKPKDLSIMTNHIESRLGSRISDSSALEFVTYVPAKQPLFISSNLQNPIESRTSSFLVPRWGGIYIYNHDNNQNDNLIQANEAVKTFLSQFIDLIGIKLHKNSKNFARSKIYSSEIYRYLLEKTLENQLNSINTLKSLSLLLTRINNMVIEDDIAEQVKISVEAIQRSLALARDGKIDEAFFSSKIAFASSEKAFFDKSLLEKLYFPEDQRFAIYIPLFIPVGIPLLLSFKSIIGWIKEKKNKQKNLKID